MSQKEFKDRRSYEELRMHYEIEKRLADGLLRASKSERRFLYSSVYNELFLTVPSHPQLKMKSDISQNEHVNSQLTVLRRFICPEFTFMEIGAGDCKLAFAVSELVRRVYAIDVSASITENTKCPENFELILSDGCSIPILPNSIDLAYSYQLIEHLHPDDAFEQLRNIYAALKPGGTYICITPNRLSGPHDISQYFNVTPKGLHLKEYSYYELALIFKKVGFRNIYPCLSMKGFSFLFSTTLINSFETLFGQFPYRLRKFMGNNAPFRNLLGIMLLAKK